MSLLEKYYADKVIKLNNYNLTQAIRRKNPYLLSASGLSSVDSLIDNLIESFIQTSDETKFGQDIFEPLAIKVSSGRKSTTSGVDLELERNGKLYLVAVKSGPFIFNSSSRAKQRDYFNSALRVYRTGTNNSQLQVVPLVGYCYGTKRARRENADNFEEYAGEKFWEFLSDGDRNLYLKIAEVIATAQISVQNRFKNEIQDLKKRWRSDIYALNLDDEGRINWEALTRLVSANVA